MSGQRDPTAPASTVLDAATIEAIARRSAELTLESLAPILATRPTQTDLVDTTTAAQRLGVSADYLRDHADELGAVRLGNGPKPRLRFDVGRIRDLLAPDQSAAPAPRATPRRRARTASVPLLPIGATHE